MKCIVQRMGRAACYVDGKTVGEIGKGLLVLCGFIEEDTEEKIDWVARRIARLRIFPDENGKLNLSVRDIGGEILIISNFTLYADCNHGTRPDFSRAAKGSISRPMYEYFVKKMSEEVPVQTGRFGEHMELDLYSDGPITVTVER